MRFDDQAASGKESNAGGPIVDTLVIVRIACRSLTTTEMHCTTCTATVSRPNDCASGTSQPGRPSRPMPATGRTHEYVANRARRPQVSPCPRTCRSNTDQRAHDGTRRSNARRLCKRCPMRWEALRMDQKRRKSATVVYDAPRLRSRKSAGAARLEDWMSTCNEAGCDLTLYSLGWCRKHADRNRQADTVAYRQRLEAASNTPQHGTRSRYRKGCRCTDCRHAETAYRRQYRKAQR